MYDLRGGGRRRRGRCVRAGVEGADFGASLPRLEFVSEVRKKMHEARAGVLAERKALQEATEHRDLMAWNQAENQRLHELR